MLSSYHMDHVQIGGWACRERENRAGKGEDTSYLHMDGKGCWYAPTLFSLCRLTDGVLCLHALHMKATLGPKSADCSEIQGPSLFRGAAAPIK